MAESEYTKVIQFKIPNTSISYGLKLKYDETNILEGFERLEIRREDRPVNFNMLTAIQKEAFLEHYEIKVSKLPIKRK